MIIFNLIFNLIINLQLLYGLTELQKMGLLTSYRMDGEQIFVCAQSCEDVEETFDFSKQDPNTAPFWCNENDNDHTRDDDDGLDASENEASTSDENGEISSDDVNSSN